ncbi:hypothetical protein JX580_06515 [Thiomicrospira microaerophila]|uniref:hypothetical protein n=1 Tax=Thiomicrospira microaerophila TaxID=406020 RepID=UPI00200F2B9D|nr:hypothetical protein [Thiomicrospira microaerophila]UQB41352.1 hypothetical protein JX580_06515 [Thiomicrospira microaerophila]
MALTLKNAFEATFRSNYRFEDFLALKVEQAATRKKLGDRNIIQPNAKLKA